MPPSEPERLPPIPDTSNSEAGGCVKRDLVARRYEIPGSVRRRAFVQTAIFLARRPDEQASPTSAETKRAGCVCAAEPAHRPADHRRGSGRAFLIKPAANTPSLRVARPYCQDLRSCRVVDCSNPPVYV